MSIAGKLIFSLTTSEQGETEVSVLSSRPLQVARLLEGKSVDQALTTIPLLFRVCGKAQAVAAIRAIESALEITAGRAIEQRRRRLLDLETLREHLWRILLDWPRFYCQATATTPATRAIRLANELLQRVADDNACLINPGLTDRSTANCDVYQGSKDLRTAMERELYAMNLTDWLRLDLNGLQCWLAKSNTSLTRMLNYVLDKQWQSLGTANTRFLPPLNPEVLLSRLDAPDADTFIALPDWDGVTHYETGAFARVANDPLIIQLLEVHGPGLLARLVARLVETARLGVASETQTDTPGAISTRFHSGLGVAEAARGRLYHRAVVRNGTIAYYRLLAPTEWNFHPHGPAAKALRDIDSDDPSIARRQAELLIHAIDPCVEYEIQIGDVNKSPTDFPLYSTTDFRNA